MSDKISQTSIENFATNAGWHSAYCDLRALGLDWKKAAFAAWYNAPKASRRPETQEQLADLLNYASPQVFYKWQKQDWWREIGIDGLRERILLNYLGEVDQKTIEAALDGSHQDRKLFYEQLAQARPDKADEAKNRLEIWLRMLRNGEDNEPLEKDE